MFSIVGNLNFLFVCEEYRTLFKSTMTLIDSSMGNYDFSVFNQIEDPNFKIVGQVYLLLVVIVFTILILNLVIAILSNTYNIYDPKSKGLYLSKILSTRDELLYHENYGAFLSSMTPLSIVTIPFVPFAIKNESSRLNNLVMVLQYILLMVIMFTGFIFVSAALIPFAFLKSFVFKFKFIYQANSTQQIIWRSLRLIMFIFLGMGFMTLTFFTDCYYFWKNNFRKEKHLKKIVIEREPSTITSQWIKKIKLLCAKYSFNRIKAVYMVEYVRKFREDLDINAQLQFLIFGQFIGKQKQKERNVGRQIKSINRMKTQYMIERREKEKKAKFDTTAYDNSLYMINQFNQMKKIAANQSFADKGEQVLCTDIIVDIIDELRRDRKIKMAIKDSNYIKEYIAVDLDEADQTDA